MSPKSVSPSAKIDSSTEEVNNRNLVAAEITKGTKDSIVKLCEEQYRLVF